jgi:hypothetical protein
MKFCLEFLKLGSSASSLKCISFRSDPASKENDSSSYRRLAV